MLMNEHPHATHPAIVNRLKRAEGHLRKIITMIEAERSCLDLVQQLHAVEQAITNAKKTLIHDHIDHCLEQSVGPLTRQARVPIDEFKAITKYL
jgi:DNA-binding FrmR family transcriptional regulator